MKRFEYFLLGKELKAQNDIEEKKHQKLDNIYRLIKTILKKTIVNQM